MSEQVIQLRAHEEGGVKLSITRYCGPGSSDDRMRLCLMVGGSIDSNGNIRGQSHQHVLDRKSWTLLKKYVDDSVASWDDDRQNSALRREVEQKNILIKRLKEVIKQHE